MSHGQYVRRGVGARAGLGGGCVNFPVSDFLGAQNVGSLILWCFFFVCVLCVNLLVRELLMRGILGV